MKSLLAAGLVLVGMVGAGCAQTAKRPMTFADLMAMKRVSDPQVSPSGKWVLFSVTDVSLEKNTKVNHLWVVPLGGSGSGVAGSGGVPPMSQNRDMGHPESLGGEKQVTSGDGESFGRFSPDGKWISFSTKDQIYLAPWDEANGTIGEERALTSLSTGADGGIWSPDSKSIAFTSEVYSDCSGWTLDDACNRTAMQQDAESPTKAMIFTHLLYRHWTQFQAPLATLDPLAGGGIARLSHILMVHLTAPAKVFDLTPPFDWGNNVIAPTFSLGGPLGYAWSPNSKEIAFVVNADKEPAASTNNDIYVVDVTLHDGPHVGKLDFGKDHGWAPKKISTSLGSDDGPQYSPDGKWLAFRSQKRAGYESDRFRLMLFDRQTKTIKELMPKFDRWVDEFVWAPNSSTLYFASADRGGEPIYSVGVGGADLNVRTWLDLNAEWGEYGSLSVGGKFLVATRMSIQKPAEVYLMRVGVDSGINVDDFGYAMTGYKPPLPGTVESATPSMYKVEQLTHLNDTVLSRISYLDRSGDQALNEFHFKGAGGTDVEGFVVKPPDFDSDQKYPVKFLIHGGPQGAWGDAWSYRWNAELMAASGYVVVMVNPRGSTGYGQEFIDGVNGDWGGKAYVDLMKGLDAAEKQFPFIDKDRECALGASYGGYMANWVLTHTNRFKCIVTHDGMYNPAAAYGDTDELWFNEWEFRRPGDLQPGQPWRYAAGPEANDPFRKWSPMLHIQDAKTPTLVIHSQKDYRLDVSEGLQLFTALQRLGVPSEMLYFPDEGHWVQKPKNAELWNKTVSDWCDQWTKH